MDGIGGKLGPANQLDKNVRIPEDAIIGYDQQKDALYHHVTESGIVVVEGHRSTVEVSSIAT